MIKFLCLIAIVCTKLRLCSFFSNQQGLKSIKQIDRYFKEVSTYFSFEIKDSLSENWNKNIFLLLEGKELAAFLQIESSECYNQGTQTQRNSHCSKYLSIYCVTVTDKYRGEGLSYFLMRKAISAIKAHYNLPDNTMLALHLSSENKEMFIAMKTYYKLGFTKGTFSKYGPPEFQYCVNDLFKYSNDIYKMACDTSISKTEGHFVVMYCYLKNFDRGNVSMPADFVEKGKHLMEVCNERRKNNIL